MTTTETGATLRIRSAEGTAAHVTEILGIEPSRAIEIGDSVGKVPPRIATQALWSLDSPIDESPLAAHLTDLCNRLAPVAGQLYRLANEGYALDWFCFVSAGEQGSVDIDQHLLRMLAALPVDLTLDLYLSNEDETDTDQI
jgi:hypothetical protein